MACVPAGLAVAWQIENPQGMSLVSSVLQSHGHLWRAAARRAARRGGARDAD